MRATIAILAAALGTGIIAAPASANASIERVSYADLDLTSLDGQAELQNRLEKAASRVCKYEPDGSLRNSREFGSCYRAARQNVAVQFASLVSDRALGG